MSTNDELDAAAMDRELGKIAHEVADAEQEDRFLLMLRNRIPEEAFREADYLRLFGTAVHYEESRLQRWNEARCDRRSSLQSTKHELSGVSRVGMVLPSGWDRPDVTRARLPQVRWWPDASGGGPTRASEQHEAIDEAIRWIASVTNAPREEGESSNVVPSQPVAVDFANATFFDEDRKFPAIIELWTALERQARLPKGSLKHQQNWLFDRLPDCWLFLEHPGVRGAVTAMGYDTRSSRSERRYTWQGELAKLLALHVTDSDHAAQGDVRIVRFSGAGDNPRLRGFLVRDGRERERILLHAAWCLLAGRPRHPTRPTP